MWWLNQAMFTLTCTQAQTGLICNYGYINDVFTLLPGEHPTLEAWGIECEHKLKLN